MISHVLQGELNVTITCFDSMEKYILVGRYDKRAIHTCDGFDRNFCFIIQRILEMLNNIHIETRLVLARVGILAALKAI